MGIDGSAVVWPLVGTALGFALGILLPRAWKLSPGSQEAHAALGRDHEFLKGKVAGQAEELLKFEIRYQPIVVEDDGFIKRSFDAGYEMQVFYNGFPVGDPTRRITHRQEKAKDENVNRVLEAITSALNVLAVTNSKSRLATTIVRAPFRKLGGASPE